MEHEMKEREKNETLKSKQRQTLESIKDQIHAKEEQKRLEMEENKRIAEDYKRRQEVVKDKAQKELQRRLFQEQTRDKEHSRVMEFNMSETNGSTEPRLTFSVTNVICMHENTSSRARNNVTGGARHLR